MSTLNVFSRALSCWQGISVVCTASVDPQIKLTGNHCRLCSDEMIYVDYWTDPLVTLPSPLPPPPSPTSPHLCYVPYYMCILYTVLVIVRYKSLVF